MEGIEELRKSRKFMGDVSLLDSPHIAYLGLHNSEPFLSDILNWLGVQERKDIALLVCDNKSLDNTWTIATKEILRVYPNSVFVQAPINLGGYGAFSLNFDLFGQAKWITTFHQDDRYAPNHLALHANLAATASENLGIIASEQESYSPSGTRLAFPRANWFLPKDADPATVFLANLRNHALPFSGASFNLQLLNEIVIPWHSSAFPDTEIVLRMLPKWAGILDSASMVQYLENPFSESHALEDSERELGATMSLARVFSSSNFSELCRQVIQTQKEEFVLEVISGIQHRIHDLTKRSFVTTLALESMFQEFGPIRSISKNLEGSYNSVGALSTTKLLHKLHTFPETDLNEACLVNPQSELPFKRETTRSQKRDQLLRKVVPVLLGVLPKPIGKWVISVVLVFAKSLGFRSAWHFSYWRSKGPRTTDRK